MVEDSSFGGLSKEKIVLAFFKLLCYDVKNNLKGNFMMNVMLNSLERREEERRLL